MRYFTSIALCLLTSDGTIGKWKTEQKSFFLSSAKKAELLIQLKQHDDVHDNAIKQSILAGGYFVLPTLTYWVYHGFKQA